MILVNTETIPGHKIESQLGLVRGSTVRAKNIGKDIFASFKNLVGGEVTQYTELMNESRDQALERMVKSAEAIGADAVINIRFTTSAISQGMSELMVYGTAVKISS